MTDYESVQRYIDTKKAVLANMRRLQNLLFQVRGEYYADNDRARAIWRQAQMILDDPFQADGLPTSP